VISKWAAAFAALLVMLATGCSSHGSTASHSRAVLYQGIGLRQPRTAIANRRVTDAAARRGGARVRKQWEREVRRRAIKAPREQFANFSPCAQEAAREGRPRSRLSDCSGQVPSTQRARSRDRRPHDALALVRALPGILRSLDPHSGRTDTHGWSYEGFYFEAQDERGMPFLGVYNFWRGQHKGGGECARSEPLYPFEHG
jgi:hypothetical protein